MAKGVRIALSLVVTAAALAAIWSWSIAPIRCIATLALIKPLTIRAVEAGSDAAMPQARVNLERLDPCMRSCDNNIDNYMLAAANERILGHLPEAEKLYEGALQWDRRPEIYFNLGLLQLDLQKTDAALANLERASIFNAEYVDAIPYPEIRENIRKKVYVREMVVRGRRLR